jgi:hypothetical protein
MPSQSTLSRIPRIERLAAIVQAVGALVLAIGPVAGVVTMAHQSIDASGLEGNHHVGEGILVLAASVVAGLTLLLNAAYVQHRLILDRGAAERD